MTASAPSGRSPAGRIIWALTVVASIAAVALLRVPTHLGVKVVEANQGAPFNSPVLDFTGHDYLWRVWWRARDDMVSVNPSWLLGVALLAGLVLFVVGIFAAYRLALSVPSDAPPRDV